MGKRAKLERQRRQQELLKLFVGDFYQEKKIGDNWYVKMWNGGTGKWQVAVYSLQSFRNYKAATERNGPKLRDIAQEEIVATGAFRDTLNDKLKSLGL